MPGQGFFQPASHHSSSNILAFPPFRVVFQLLAGGLLARIRRLRMIFRKAALPLFEDFAGNARLGTLRKGQAA